MLLQPSSPVWLLGSKQCDMQCSVRISKLPHSGELFTLTVMWAYQCKLCCLGVVYSDSYVDITWQALLSEVMAYDAGRQ